MDSMEAFSKEPNVPSFYICHTQIHTTLSLDKDFTKFSNVVNNITK